MSETLRSPELSTSEEVSRILLHNQVFSIENNVVHLWSGGLKSPIYSDLRLMLSDVDGRTKITDYFVSYIQQHGSRDVIAGTATAGIPWAAYISERMRLPLAYVRPTPKGHGKKNQVEGRVFPEQKAIVIEDTLSSAGSSIESVKALRANGASVDTVFAIMNYMLPSSKENARQASIILNSLTDFPTIMRIAEKENYWNKQQVELVKEWYKNPYEWGMKL